MNIAVADSVFTVFNDEPGLSNFAAANITIDTDAPVTVICFWYRGQEQSSQQLHFWVYLQDHMVGDNILIMLHHI